MVTIQDDGNRKTWLLYDLRHRVDGPAVEWINGSKEWFLNGLCHRIDGPACEWCDGTKEWFLHGQHHRIDGPAFEQSDGYKAWFLNGVRHRIDGPAIQYHDGRKEWYLHNKRLSPPEIKAHQISRLRDLGISLLPLQLPPYVIFWILEWSENAYIADLDQRSVIKMIEGIRNSRQKLKNIFI